MAPTRELAIQIDEEFKKLAFGFGMFSAACVGGLPISKQIREIKMGVSFIIGTPGRLRDLIDQKVIDLSTCYSVVLDEADRMLDMGFRDDMDYSSSVKLQQNTKLFSSQRLFLQISKSLTEKYLKDPAFISVLSGELRPRTLNKTWSDVKLRKKKSKSCTKFYERMVLIKC
jgi:superfamily II DNA/RNA helicase